VKDKSHFLEQRANFLLVGFDWDRQGL